MKMELIKKITNSLTGTILISDRVTNFLFYALIKA